MKKMSKRLLSLLLAVIMVAGVLPVMSFAEGETATYTKISTMEELTTGQYVMVVSTGYGPGVLDSGWLTAEAITADGNTITAPAATAVWDITVDGTTAKLTDSNGVTVAPKGGNNNGIQSGDYRWNVTCADGTFTFAGQGADTVLLASNKSSGNKFRAYKNTTVSGNPGGYPSKFTLYKCGVTEPARESGLVTDLTTLQDGDTVVVFNPANMKALSTTYTGFYNNGTDVTLADGKLSGYTENDIWTVGVNEDGSYTFSTAEGKKLSMGASYSSMPLDDVNPNWEISEAATTDCYYIKNTVRGSYIEWYADKGNWSSYSKISDEALFAQQIYLVVESGTPDPGPEPTPDVPLRDGDQVVIYNPAYNKALSTTYTGFYNNGTDVTETEGVLSGYTENDIWTVGDNGDGTYTFSTAEGKKLSMGASYSSMPLDDANPNWEVSEAATTDCYYIKNTVRGNYIEWYADKGNWSSYSKVSDEALFALKFYKIPVQREEGIVTKLYEGDTVVVFNPANMKALSTTYTGFYNNGTDVTLADGKLSGYTENDIWTVGVNEDGSYTFSTAEGKKLSMGASYSSMPLDDVNPNWEISEAATTDCYYIKNTVRGSYIEWYADKGNWSSYSKISDEALFAQQFYLVVNSGSEPAPGGEPKEGDKVVIYNLSAKGVLSLQDDNTDSPAITGVSATVEDGKATAANGGLIFTVEKNGDYYRFKNKTFGYLCSNGTGNNAFYNSEASEDADWKLAVQGTGYTMESRTAKYNGKYSQYLEYYADSYKTYSMYNVTDYDIYTFQFYPCGNDTKDITGGVVNMPTVDFGTLPAAHVGADYTFSFTVDAVFGVDGELTVKAGGTQLAANADGSYTVPAELVMGESLTITVTGKDTKGVAISGTTIVTVVDEPVISDLTPAAGGQTGENKRPVISAKISNAGENPTVTMTVNGTKVGSGYTAETGVVSYTPSNDLPDGRTTVTVTVARADNKTASKSWSFTVGTAKYQLYFGQLHSHTGEYSDGSGTLASALDYVKNLPDSANVDFVAFTDHSNYFDASGAANPEGALYDMNLATAQAQSKWSTYKNTVAQFNANQSDVLAIAGFEMTWSGGPGHINTFNTPGIVSRNNSTLNNKSADAGMKAYYALLSQPEGAESLSQFNHPGSTFGTFSDFAYWDPVIDARMYMVEVGNGEGAIGAGGYYPSYEYYTMALDKGWHLAPTNNQDNHKGKWGNANDARDVILTDDFSEDGLYDAIRAMKMYATEDKNLEIGYTVNDLPLGSSIKDVPETLNINVTVNDPDSTDSISKVEVIVNSGKVAYTWSNPAELATGNLTVTLDPDYSYYYIRVTEGDGDLAVTAPVWVGEALKLGISSVECGTSTPVTGEELTLTTTLFNSEVADATVKSMTYTVKGSETVLGTDTSGYTVPASGTLAVDFKYTPDIAKVMTVTVTAVIEQNGKEYTFTKDIELDILNADELVYIGIDASHYNEYVAGNYKDSMGNFGQLAAGYSVRTVELKNSADLIAACSNPKYKALILTAPSRRDGSALRDPYATYSEEEINALVDFNKNGGAVVLCGWGDYYESYAEFPAEDHMAAQQNKILTALGSSLRISDDETKDDTWNGGQAQRLYFSSYNFDSFLLDGVEYDAENPHNNMYTELYSQYGGASIYTLGGSIPETVTSVVFGFDTTYSADDDKDSYGGLGSIPKYTFDGADRLMVMATEQLPDQGLIVVAGAAFLSNFEVQATISDSGAEKNYSNYKICENLVKFLNPVTVTDIATVRAQTEAGYKYTIEGVVTSNASGYDKDTAFFDCIYVQDATGGICCFPVAGNYKIGDVVQITGTTDFYQGEPELQVTDIKKTGETAPVVPAAVTAAQVNSRSVEGKLITVSGTVTKIIMANELPESIYVKDSSGSVARVFIDGYITKDKAIANLAVGCSIAATGLASYDNTYADTNAFPRIRVRDRADVVCTAGGSGGEIEPPVIVLPGTPVIPTMPGIALPFTDVRSSDWFYEDVEYVYNEGLMNGTGKTKFSPNADLTRAMVVTILYRIENEPVAGKADMFGDVSSGQWYTKAVAWAAENGIVNGYSNGNFGPNDPITREQLATILYRYTKFKSGNVEASRNYLDSFSDAGQVSAYAVEAMNWAVAGGLINGSDGKLMPTARASRAQVAAIIHRYLEG